jgi:probable F420-dependent oxidoreductase
MRIGYFSTLHADGIRPDELARELETRRFDSLWLPEHSHIPVVYEPTRTFATEIPDSYLHLLDPYVALASAAGTTTTLRLATGVAMALEHDALDLACRVATLDLITGGRLTFGVGVGWLPEELANHRPDVPFTQRYTATVERIQELRTAWIEEEASFEGRWDRYTASRVFPKPLQRPLPVAFGSSGPLGIRLAAQHADEWCPIDTALRRVGGIEEGLARFRSEAEAAGRDPTSIPVTLFVWGWSQGDPPHDRLLSYADLGVDRVVVCPPTIARHDRNATLRRLDEFAALT